MRRAKERGILGVAIVSAALAASCAPRLVQPTALMSPYGTERLFAMAPPVNESGTTTIDSIRVAELFTEELEQVTGIRALPMSRVLAAMQAMQMERVSSTHDAIVLMNALGVDGLVVGSITSWDPYPPMRLGMSVELLVRDAPTGALVDPRDLTMSVGSAGSTGTAIVPGSAGQATAQASGIFDAANHETLKALAIYANGRSEPESAYGSDIFLVSKDPFTRFVSYELVADLLEVERDRLAAAAAAQSAAAQASAQATAQASGDVPRSRR